MKIIRLLKNMLAVEKRSSSVTWLRKQGAIIGEDVELHNFTCSAKDATCLQIGNHVTLTGVVCLTHDASLKRVLRCDCNKIGRIVIGNNVFIGKQTVILPNVHIGDDVVIGCGSVVTHDIPEGTVAVGNPAKVICTTEEFKQKHLMKMKTNPELVYKNTKKRYEMKPNELKKFNDDIDGKIIYFIQ